MPVGSAFTSTIAERLQPPTVYIIEVVPALRPVTTPAVDTVPTAGVLLLHVPPVVVLVSVVVPFTQMLVIPVITAGNGFTVSTAVLRQPLVRLYVIVDVPPGAIPVATPVPRAIVATVVVPLIHVPPVGAPVRVVFVPAQMLSVPLMDGVVFTVATAVTVQPEPSE